MSREVRTTVLIIGSGFSGICLGIRLLEAGIDDFLILEKAAEAGGTWRENTYPGAECDVPSALYSYSFEANARWRYKWAERDQIQEYLLGVADRHKLGPHMVFGQRVAAGAFDPESGCWSVKTAGGQQYRARFLVPAVGQLHHPRIPRIPGIDQFQGASFHSAQWDHGVDLAGKRVAVIGSAASAIQFIPQIAGQVEHLAIFQRSPNWMLPKQDRPYYRWEHWLADRFKWWTRLHRLRLWLRAEFLFLPMIQGKPWARRLGHWMARRNLHGVIKDPELRRALTPDYPIGAKRVLFSDDYYQTLLRDNIELVTAGISSLNAGGIVRDDGVTQSFDCIIYATGFITNPFLYQLDLRGKDDQSIRQAWDGGAHAYLGIMTHGFPNLFMMYGPNTNLGHNSMVLMFEAQAHYITRAIIETTRRGDSWLEVRPEAEQAYNEEIQQRLQGSVWTAVSNWYRDGDRITNNWPGSTREYARRTRRVNWDHLQAT
ncbi:MAG: NAD(P)/FAD-dependent oxidoreductase [Xanthomonadales bacterium]|nr:NAD(P)/FAD-dependent oxidoreductase [Xanthomonadales bacterium]